MTSLPKQARLAAAAALALSTGNALAGDRLFVSTFLGGEIARFDLPSPVPTYIVSGLLDPEDGACHPATGDIYFAESLTGRITRWDQDGFAATDIIPAAGAVDGPEGLSFDDFGDLYFSTREILGTADGAWQLARGEPTEPLVQIVPRFTSFGEGTDIVLAGPHAGALLLVARGESEVWISEPPGAPLRLLLAASEFPFGTELYGVATNGCGEIFVSFAPRILSSAPSEVYRFDAEGRFLEVYASGFLKAGFLEFDSAGDLYVADSEDARVWRIAPDRTATPFADVFGGPTGLAICRDARVPTCGLTCAAGGPYAAECGGARTCLRLDGSGAGTGGSGPFELAWTSDCPGASLSDPTAVDPELCIDTADLGCGLDCRVDLTVRSGSSSETCSAPVTVHDTLPPVVVGCELRPPLPPIPPSSASSSSSARARASFEVDCGVTGDACDELPEVTARVVLAWHEVVDGACVPNVEEIPVTCGERLELHRRAPPCPARPPRSPRPPVSVGSDGVRRLTAESFQLEVDALDACGLRSDTCGHTPADQVLDPPRPVHCPVPRCGE